MTTPETREPEPIDPRVLLAAERTLLAWVRTGLALMGLGFVVARFGLFLRELAVAGHVEPDAHSPQVSQWLGMALLLFGIIVNLLAAAQHVRFLRRLERGEHPRPTFWSLSMVITVILSLFGLGLIGYLLTY